MMAGIACFASLRCCAGIFGTMGQQAESRLESGMEAPIMDCNKTRQGYALRSTLKPAGYLFLRSSQAGLYRAF
jgi:hypothetical protein